MLVEVCECDSGLDDSICKLLVHLQDFVDAVQIENHAAWYHWGGPSVSQILATRDDPNGDFVLVEDPQHGSQIIHRTKTDRSSWNLSLESLFWEVVRIHKVFQVAALVQGAVLSQNECDIVQRRVKLCLRHSRWKDCRNLHVQRVRVRVIVRSLVVWVYVSRCWSLRAHGECGMTVSQDSGSKLESLEFDGGMVEVY